MNVVELLQAEVAFLTKQAPKADQDAAGWAALILRALDRAELPPAVQAEVLLAVNFELEEVISPECGPALSPTEGRL
jgi:hypothetical protein